MNQFSYTDNELYNFKKGIIYEMDNLNRITYEMDAQLIDPLNNLTLSALVAAVPSILYFLGPHKKDEGLSGYSLITSFFGDRLSHSGVWNACKTGAVVCLPWSVVRVIPHLLDYHRCSFSF